MNPELVLAARSLKKENLGINRTRFSLNMVRNVRILTSKKKNRFIDGDLDLDLSYITDQLIAMGYPSVGFERFYRNPSADVVKFLNSRHPGHYKIWNLVIEREYDPLALGFADEVERYCFYDHCPPAFESMFSCCDGISRYLGEDPDNVAVIHCKAGKGRTGTIISAYLVHAGIVQTAAEALTLFGWRRTRNGKGVTIPSQQRYVRYSALQSQARKIAMNRKINPVSSVVIASKFGNSSSPPAMCKIISFEKGDSLIVSLELTRDRLRSIGISLKRDLAGRVIISAVNLYGSPVKSQEGLHFDRHMLNVDLPIYDVLQVGDEIISVSNENVRKMKFVDIINLLRGAPDPVSLTVSRVSFIQPILPPPESVEDYVLRINNGIGPWAGSGKNGLGADPRVTPTPSVLIQGVTLSCAPLNASKSSSNVSCVPSCSGNMSSNYTEDPLEFEEFSVSDLRLQLYGGVHCRTLIFDSDSTAAPSPSSVPVDAPSSSVDKSTSRQSSSPSTKSPVEVGENSNTTPMTSRSQQRSGRSLRWGKRTINSDNSPGITGIPVRGDFRLVVKRVGKKKPILSAWLHSAFLPLPGALCDTISSATAAIRAKRASAANLEQSSVPPSSGASVHTVPSDLLSGVLPVATVAPNTSSNSNSGVESSVDSKNDSEVYASSSQHSDSAKADDSGSKPLTDDLVKLNDLESEAAGISPSSSSPVSTSQVALRRDSRTAVPVPSALDQPSTVKEFSGPILNLKSLTSSPLVSTVSSDNSVETPIATLRAVTDDVTDGLVEEGMPSLGAIWTASGHVLDVDEEPTDIRELSASFRGRQAMQGRPRWESDEKVQNLLKGRLVIERNHLDGVVKDKKFKAWPKDFHITMDYSMNPVGLPRPFTASFIEYQT